MSVKMIAEFRKKPSLARLKVAREERARIRAEEISALELFARAQVGIDFGVVEPEAVVIHDGGLDPAEARLLDVSLQRAQLMTDFDEKFGF